MNQLTPQTIQVLCGTIFSLLGLVFFESFARRQFPNSLFRPTNSIDHLTNYATRFFSWLGFQFARFTDLYYLIKELFPYEDILRLLNSIWALIGSIFHLFKGYYDYYTQGMTPIQYGVVSSAVVIGFIGILFYFFWKPAFSLRLYNAFHNCRRKIMGVN